MKQNNAAQPVLTDDEINAACGRHAADTGWHAENDRKKARAVESAVLSKLRAPVAPAPDGFVPVAASVLRTLAEPGLIKRTLGKFSPALAAKLGFTPEEEKAIEAMYLAFGESFDYPCAPLASAPVAEPETMEEIHRRERERAPWKLPKDPTLPDSAPVAGEAQPTDAEIIDLAVEPLGIDCDRMPHGVVVFARNLLSRYAAPQASEAVRDAERWRSFRNAVTQQDLGWLDRMDAALTAMGCDLDDEAPPSADQVDAAADAASAALSAQPGAQRTGDQ